MARALVTGAGGFIGKALTQALLRAGHEVLGTVRPGAPAQAFQTAEVDVSDATALLEVGEKWKPEWVFHLAASNIQSGVTADTESLIRTNIQGTDAALSMAEAVNVTSFVHIGSFLEYGPKGVPLKEDMLCEPPEIYSVTKLAGTLLVQTAAKTRALHTVAFRLFTPYGPGIQQGRLVREMLTSALRNEPLTLTRPTVSRDFVYIDDICNLLIEAAKNAEAHTGQIYNLGSGRKTTLEELTDIVRTETGSQTPVSWGGFKQVAYDADTWQADMEKTFSAFAWRPTTDLARGIHQTAEWLRSSL
ncbi:MAG TPA: NAD-dependent epimerase/dehydratase family protein [Candidatus Paceibacterota bacterium]|nr:NAD-dependent epimerase/dehydratase family protein [Candidatus Paceibacterota bacterium]